MMWSNMMRTSPTMASQSVSGRRELSAVETGRLALGGLERWRYLAVDHDPSVGLVSRRQVRVGAWRDPSDGAPTTTAGAIAVKAVGTVGIGGDEDRGSGGWDRRTVDELRTALAGIHDQLTCNSSLLPVLRPCLFGSPIWRSVESDGTFRPRGPRPGLARSCSHV